MVRNLYSHAKSCVRGMDGESEYFASEIGVRQGENLSPLLFGLYLNDFKGVVDKASPGLTDISTMVDSRANDLNDLDTLFKMSVLRNFFLISLRQFSVTNLPSSPNLCIYR